MSGGILGWGNRQNVHIATGVVASDVPAFGDIVVWARVRTKEPAGNFMLVRGLGRRLKEVSQRIVTVPSHLRHLWVALTWCAKIKDLPRGVVYGDRLGQGQGKEKELEADERSFIDFRER